MWGDSHDTIHCTNIGATHISQTDATTIGYGTQHAMNGIAVNGLPTFWTLNHWATQHWNDSDNTKGNPSAVTKRAGPGNDELQTIAHFAIKDTDAGATTETMPIGSPHLGNTVIADSCGVIGFDGVFVATATFANSSDHLITPTSYCGYTSINIIVIDYFK